MIKTSAESPLRVDAIPAWGGVGMVGMTLCPGKKQPQSLAGGWSRDLAADLSAIRTWGAQVLVSLMEPAEFARFQVSVPELERRTRDLGMEWISAPIVDTSIPDAAFLDLWRATAPRLRRIVDEGGAVVFHCLGGLGRSGTMAACLLIETGYGCVFRTIPFTRFAPCRSAVSEQAVHPFRSIPFTCFGPSRSGCKTMS